MTVSQVPCQWPSTLTRSVSEGGSESSLALRVGVVAKDLRNGHLALADLSVIRAPIPRLK
jgi:hypothetical protein